MKKYTAFATAISIIVLVVSSLPIIYFSFFPKDNLLFLGRRYINSQDVYTYVSFIEQARQGRNLFENLFTSEPQKPSLIRPSYLLIGKFANAFGASSVNAYQTSRIVFCILFFFVLWKFLDLFFIDQKHKFIAYTLLITSSGFGFFIFKWFNNSTDLWISESNTFFSLGEAPHFILSQALMLGGYYLFIDYLKNKNVSSILVSCLLFLALSFEHPFNLVVIAPVLFLTAVWNTTPWIKSALIALGASIGLIYAYYSTVTNPILALWQNQNILLSPIPLAYASGFGFILILAIIGLEKMLNEKLSITNKFLIVWITINSFLLYFPVNFQRRLVEGLHIPLGIVSTFGLLYLIQNYKTQKQNLLITITIAVLSLTSIFMVYTDFSIINTDKSDSYYYHISSDEMKAIKWLGDNTNSNDIVLSNWYMGNLIPGLIGRKVYIGHKIQTANWDTKTKSLDLFIQNSNSDLSHNFLVDNKISYMFIGRNDVILQSGFKPENYPDLKSVYNQDGVAIYQVLK